MKLKKALLVTGTVSTVGLSSIIGAGVVSAQSNTTANNESQSLVDKIATKFNLNKSDVQAVFDQDRQEHEAEHQKHLEQRLDKLVSEGKITSSQKTLILNKLKELQSTKDSLRDKAPAERRKLMEQERVTLQQWAKDNNIPTQYVPFLHAPDGPPPTDQAIN